MPQAGCMFLFRSVQFSRSVVSDSLRPHESQHARPPCLSPTPGVYSNSCPSSWWCHPAISCSVVPFSSCPQSLPASGSLPMSQLFAWGGQSIGVSASAPVLPMDTHPGLTSFRMDSSCVFFEIRSQLCVVWEGGADYSSFPVPFPFWSMLPLSNLKLVAVFLLLELLDSFLKK